MDDIYAFLAHAVQLETDAARRFEELAEQMRTAGNSEVQEFFQQMAEFSR
ncbi:MAG: ferritin family protein [Propionivibrio sp.]